MKIKIIKKVDRVEFNIMAHLDVDKVISVEEDFAEQLVDAGYAEYYFNEEV